MLEFVGFMVNSFS